MKLNKSIKYISITLLVIGFCVSVLWGGSLQAGSGDTLKDWVGNTVDVLTENPADNYPYNDTYVDFIETLIFFLRCERYAA